MNREQGLAEIEKQNWRSDEDGTEIKITVHDKHGRPVTAYITPRPAHCDRGHLMLQIDGFIDLDEADSFPRYFFSVREAMEHTKMFLQWRLWRHASPDRPCQRSLEQMIRESGDLF